MAGVHAMMIVGSGGSGGSGGCMEGDKLYLKPNGVTIAAQCGVAKGTWHSLDGKDYYVAKDYDDLVSVVSVYKDLSGDGEVLANLTRDGQTKSIPLNQVVTTFVEQLGASSETGNLFDGATSFNQQLASWDTSNVTDMSRVFRGCQVFNQDLSSWNVSNVTTMGAMFMNCHAFAQDISGWDTSNVALMWYMFHGCQAFDQDISGWCVSKIPSKPKYFDTNTRAAWTTARKPKWGAPC